jgi:palmitoyl-protein thioesterase
MVQPFKAAILVASAAALSSTDAAVPNAIFHGLGDCCLYPGMKNFTEKIAAGTGSYAKCMKVGNGSETSMAVNFETQAKMACDSINADENFQGEFNVTGLSQGALLARYIVEQCPMKGKVRQMLSIGGPQMGVADIPHCFNGKLCRLINTVARKFVYFKRIQDHIGPAGYFRSPHQMKEYVADSVFLAQANNEKGDDATKAAIKERFSAINGAMLVMFTEDTMVYPKESEWFQGLNKAMQVQALDKSDFYKDDYIGLKTLNEAGKVDFVSIDGDHLQFSQANITDTFIPFLLQ